jgi:hypothetical protein
MRGVLVALAFAIGVTLAAPLPASSAPVDPPTMMAQAAPQEAPKNLDIDINVNRGGTGVAWYRSPVWIAIGALAFVVLLVLIIAATRGGGTTIVKE